VTLTVNRLQGLGPTNLLAELTIHSNEVATVRFISTGSFTSLFLFVIKDGVSVSMYSPPIGTAIAGPAVFQVDTGDLGQGFCTIEITPESFPPDKTLIIPQGTGANITFECSTNLLEWTPVWQGTYTNAPSNKFFRIRADRLP
jgi:hypothetical protein